MGPLLAVGSVGELATAVLGAHPGSDDEGELAGRPTQLPLWPRTRALDFLISAGTDFMNC